MNLFSKMCFLFWQDSTWRKQEGTIGENKLRGTNIKEMEKLDFSRRDGTCANSPLVPLQVLKLEVWEFHIRA